VFGADRTKVVIHDSTMRHVKKMSKKVLKRQEKYRDSQHCAT
jgi:hypothetical protein